MIAPVKVGDVIRVAEADYCFGTGFLKMRVTEVGAVQQRQDGAWVSLVGYELRPDGSHASPQPRHALVRVRALTGRQKPRR